MGTASFDLDYRLTRTQAAGSSAVQDLTLGYDGADNISSVADAVSPNLSQTFQYDLLGRVTQGVGPYGTDNYTYDAVGNRLTRSLVNGGTTTSTTYTIASSNNQLASTASGGVTLSYTYDANGARTAIKKGNQTQASYTYNNDARLATAATAAFKYNAFGERSVETVGTGGTHFIFGSDGAMLAEHTTTGALTRNYVYLNGQPLALVDSTGTVSYVLNDQIGQPQKMLNSSGAVSWQRVAGVFGDTVSQPVGSTSANPLRFPGQWYDGNAGGLHYNYFRDYDPATGRYLQTDPIGLEGGINVYAYVAANPITKVDPKGKDVLVIMSHAMSSNPIGHVAIAVTGEGIFSKGTKKFQPGASPSEYIADQLSKRDVTLTRLKTSRAQDQAAIDAFRKIFRQPYDLYSSSCVTAARAALTAAGFEPSKLLSLLSYLSGKPAPDYGPTPASVSYLASEQDGAVTQTFQKGQSVPSGMTDQFER
jgi:RHS repeat-associated protein